MSLSALKTVSIDLPQTSSQVAKETSEKFIVHFSQANICESFQTGSLPSQDELLQLKKEAVEASFLLSCEDKAVASFYFLAKGYNNIVWGHTRFPAIVVKKMSSKQAQHQVLIAQKAHAFAQMQKPFWCCIPLSTCIALTEKGTEDSDSLYIEQRLPLGMSPDCHEEFWARIFLHLDSPNCSPSFKENQLKLANQMASLIEDVGIWDVGTKNFPEVSMDGKYVCAVDFENVPLDKASMYQGLRRLAELLPHTLYTDSLSKVYERAGVASEIASNEKERKIGRDGLPVKTPETCMQNWIGAVAKKRKDVQDLQEALLIYDTKGLTSGQTENNAPSAFDTSNLTQEEVVLGRALLIKMQEKIKECSSTDIKSAISYKRYVHWQPGRFGGSAKVYTPERFLNVLNEFKKQGLLINWSDDGSQKSIKSLTSYSIRF